MQDNKLIEPIEEIADFLSVPITLTIKDTKKFYVLREVNGHSRDLYLNNLAGRLKGKGEVTQVRDFKDMQANLLSRCIYKKVTANKEDPPSKSTPDQLEEMGEIPVTIEELRTWPARIQSLIFDRAQKLSGLDTEAEEEAGND